MTSRKLAQERGHLGLGPTVGRGGSGFGGVRESEGRGGGVWFGHRGKITDVVRVGKLGTTVHLPLLLSLLSCLLQNHRNRGLLRRCRPKSLP